MTPNRNEPLASALYAEHHRVCYPNVLVYPWEELCCTSPHARDGWLAVADMAVLNLCGLAPDQMKEPYSDPYMPGIVSKEKAVAILEEVLKGSPNETAEQPSQNAS